MIFPYYLKRDKYLFKILFYGLLYIFIYYMEFDN